MRNQTSLYALLKGNQQAPSVCSYLRDLLSDFMSLGKFCFKSVYEPYLDIGGNFTVYLKVECLYLMVLRQSTCLTFSAGLQLPHHTKGGGLVRAWPSVTWKGVGRFC